MPQVITLINALADITKVEELILTPFAASTATKTLLFDEIDFH